MKKVVRRLLAVLVLTLGLAGAMGTAHADHVCVQTIFDQHKPTICIPMP
jgi:hypothetical protein